ncbi:hypothetical protein ACP70R_012288 [Stipagrostis hirtigluma subsp. patula]
MPLVHMGARLTIEHVGYFLILGYLLKHNDHQKIFDSGNTDFCNAKIPSTAEIKTKPDGWKLPQEVRMEMYGRSHSEKRTFFSKNLKEESLSVNSSFIKTHIFSRRRPIDGWKYMIEEIGPNARKGKERGVYEDYRVCLIQPPSRTGMTHLQFPPVHPSEETGHNNALYYRLKRFSWYCT